MKKKWVAIPLMLMLIMTGTVLVANTNSLSWMDLLQARNRNL